MARILEDHDFKRGTYPSWSRWFDGQIHELTVGVDFNGDPKKAQSSVYQAAKAAGVKVKTDRTDTTLVIKVVGRREDAEEVSN